jgi:hypothetical protein
MPLFCATGSQMSRLSNITHFSAAAAALLLSFYWSAAHADVDLDEEGANDFNYVYGTVLGTGYYKTDAERLFILRVPFSHQLPESWGNTRLLVPAAIGLRNTRRSEEKKGYADHFASFSVMPGLASTFDLRENWQISPVAQYGIARDFKNNTSSWIGTVAVRHNAWWDLGSGRLTVAQRLRFAGQRNRDGGGKTGFLMLEQGADWDFDTGWMYSDKKIKASVFLLWQEYFNDLDIEGVGPAQVSVSRMFQVGLTAGFEKPLKIGWIPVERIGISIGRGDNIDGDEITAINFNLGFPLGED